MSEGWTRAGVVARKILIIAVFCASVGAIFHYAPQVLTVLSPFIAALVIAWIARPLARLFYKIHIPKKLGAYMAVAAVIVIVGGILYLLIHRIYVEVVALATALIADYQSLYESGELLRIVNEWINSLPDYVIDYFNSASIDVKPSDIINYIGNIGSFAVPIAKSVSQFAISSAASVPQRIVFVVVTIFSSATFIAEGGEMTASVKQILPDSVNEKLTFIKEKLLFALGGYLKTQLIMMSITFCELLIGFLILGVNYALLLALLIAVIDAIPVLGTGTVLVPWAIVLLFTGKENLPTAIGLLVLYVVCLSVRQFCEPKIMGSQIGMHPLVTLFAMYVGLQTIGFFGLIIGPIIAITVVYTINSRKEVQALIDEIDHEDTKEKKETINEGENCQ